MALSLRPWFPPFKKAQEEGPRCIIGSRVRAQGLRVAAGTCGGVGAASHPRQPATLGASPDSGTPEGPPGCGEGLFLRIIAETDRGGRLGGRGKIMRLLLLGPQSWLPDAHGNRENFAVGALPAPLRAFPQQGFWETGLRSRKLFTLPVALGWGGAA